MVGPIKVLHIEPAEEYQKSIRKKLSKNEFFIINAKTIEDALNKCSENKFDIILTDLELKDCNGLEVVDILRKSQPDIPVVIMTNLTGKYLEKDAAKRGAFFFFSKDEVDCPTFSRALRFAHIYYGNEYERAARGQTVALKNLESCLKKSTFFGLG